MQGATRQGSDIDRGGWAWGNGDWRMGEVCTGEEYRQGGVGKGGNANHGP